MSKQVNAIDYWYQKYIKLVSDLKSHKAGHCVLCAEFTPAFYQPEGCPEAEFEICLKCSKKIGGAK